MRIFWLTLVTFSVGTESFVLAGLLPVIANDLHVTVSTAGQLVSAYALTYALGSPLSSVAAHAVDRKLVLILALTLFIIGNLMAAAAHSFEMLMACRIIMALGTGLCSPTALGVAVAISPPERRGRAVASVMLGLTMATVLGMPLGTLLGSQTTWRAPFVMAASFALIALIGIMFRMPRGLRTETATLAERVATIRDRSVMLSLLATALWATGGFTVFTYLTVILHRIGYEPGQVSVVLFVYGSACAMGNVVGGRLVDRFGPDAISKIGLFGMAVALSLLSLVLALASPGVSRWLVPLPIIAWAVSSWCFNPAQLVTVARSAPRASTIALSLNASFMNLGFALGGMLGGAVLSSFNSSDLGWAGSSCVVASLLTLFVRHRRTVDLASV